MNHSNRVIIFWGAKDKKSLTRNFRTYFHNIIFLYCKVMNMNLKKMQVLIIYMYYITIFVASKSIKQKMFDLPCIKL